MKTLIALVVALPLVVSAQTTNLVTDFSRDLPADNANATVTLYLAGIRPLPGNTKGDIVVQLQRRDHGWAAEGHIAAANYNQKSANKIAIGTLNLDGNQLTGTLTVTIQPDNPRPGKTGFPNPPDHFEIAVDARIQQGAFIPWIPDPMPYMPPWRKDEPRFGGHKFTGTYTAKFGETEIKGDLLAGVQPAPMPDTWGAEGNIIIEPGMKLTARLAPHRVANPEGARAIKPFAVPQDWTAWNGLRITVSSDAKRDDATVALSIRRQGGGWHSVNSAALLLGNETSFDVAFTDFRSPLPDRRAITGIAIGVDNPHGVGDVTFTVTRIELINSTQLSEPAQRPVDIKLNPDVGVSFNGVTRVPKGIFGAHDVDGGTPKPKLDGQPDAVTYLQTVNPGMLRPLMHTGFGGKPIADEAIAKRVADRLANKTEPVTMDYQRAKAGNAVDNVVWCHTTDLWSPPPWMEHGLPATLESVRLFYRNLAANAWVPGDDFNTLRKFEVWNEPFMWGRSINMPGSKWQDPTQYGYLPGKLGADAWSDIFLAAVDGAKSANPHVQLGGPSAPSWDGEHYGVFRNYIAPMLDRVHSKIDFITEHHYGGNPASYAASYEVATAFMDINHGRRVPIYNTEANNQGASSAGKAAYNIADILHGIKVCPDKYVGRAIHALWNGYFNDRGEEHAYTILNTLRGHIIDVTASDPDVLIVATMPEPGKLVVLAFNTATTDREVSLPALEGFTPAETLVLIGDAPQSELELRDIEGQPIPKPAAGKTTLNQIAPAHRVVRLPTGSAVRWTLTKPGYAPSSQRVRTQHFTNALLTRVTPDQPVTAKVTWRGSAKAKRAVLRMVTADVHRNEAVAMMGNREIPLPWSSGNDGQAVVQEIELDPSLVTPDLAITFRCANPKTQNGYNIYTASVIVEE